MFSISASTGLTLPGMMLTSRAARRAGGSRPGRWPGRMHSRRKSLAMRIRSCASVRMRAGEERPRPPWTASTRTGCRDRSSVRPVSSLSLLDHARVIFGVGVQAGAGGRAADAQPAQAVGRQFDLARDRAATALAYAPNSCPRRTGTASCKCVRPDFDHVVELGGLGLQGVAARPSSAASSSSSRHSAPRRMAVGMVSLVDCAMLTWSLGLTGFLESPSCAAQNLGWRGWRSPR